jgi:hypothetical protein
MAIFTVGDENALDYVAIRDGGILVYRNLNYLEENIQWLGDRGYRIHRFDCSAWISDEAMHKSLRDELSFPDYYGNNFNALDEVIADLEVPEDGGVALVFLAYDAYADGPGTSLTGTGVDQAKIVLDILSRASHSFLLTGKRFLVMVQSNDPAMHYEDLGGRAAQWNWRECLNKDRGL